MLSTPIPSRRSTGVSPVTFEWGVLSTAISRLSLWVSSQLEFLQAHLDCFHKNELNKPAFGEVGFPQSNLLFTKGMINSKRFQLRDGVSIKFSVDGKSV